MLKASLAVGAIALSVATIAFAQTNGFSKITTEFQIVGKTPVDPPPNEKKDRVALFMSGAGAKRIYDSMPANPVSDECEVGMKSKTGGGLVCLRHADGTYDCSVAIILKSGETKPASVC